VRIPAGALAQATVVAVAPATNPPSGHIGTAYEFSPSGTAFAQPVTISIIYDETTLPVGMTALNLQLATVVNQQWQGVAGSSVDQASKTVSGSTPSFSTYGIIAVNRPDLVLPAPAWVEAVAGDGSVTVSWDPVSGATSYHVYIASQSGVTKENYGTLPNGDTRSGVTSSFEWTGLTNGTIYYVVVTAVNAGGESGESLQVSAAPSWGEPPLLPLPPPLLPPPSTAV
jgi:hypothetical protein